MRRHPLLLAFAVVMGLALASCALLYGTGLNLRLATALRATLPLEAGEIGHLAGGSGQVIVANTLVTMREVSSTNASALLTADRIFLVPNGTRVRVVQADTQYDQIAILDGALAGRTGFVPASFVVR